MRDRVQILKSFSFLRDISRISYPLILFEIKLHGYRAFVIRCLELDIDKLGEADVVRRAETQTR